MTEIVDACLSQFHDDADSFELLLAFSDGREVGHTVSRTAAKNIAAEFANEFEASPVSNVEAYRHGIRDAVTFVHHHADQCSSSAAKSILNGVANAMGHKFKKDSPVSSSEGRVAQLETELAEAIRWRDIYLRERNEDRATFFRRAGELWQPLYDRAIAKADAANASPSSNMRVTDEMVEAARFTLSGICGFAITSATVRRTLESALSATTTEGE